MTKHLEKLVRGCERAAAAQNLEACCRRSPRLTFVLRNLAQPAHIRPTVASSALGDPLLLEPGSISGACMHAHSGAWGLSRHPLRLLFSDPRCLACQREKTTGCLGVVSRRSCGAWAMR